MVLFGLWRFLHQGDLLSSASFASGLFEAQTGLLVLLGSPSSRGLEGSGEVAGGRGEKLLIVVTLV